MSERMCEATSKQGTVAVDIESSSDDGVEGTTGTEFKQRPSCLRSKERRDSPHSKRVSFGADEKEDAEILVQPNANKELKMLTGSTAVFQRRSVMVFLVRQNEEDDWLRRW